MIINILLFLVWLASLITMIVVGFHWALLVVFILTTIYFLLRMGNGALLEIIGDIFEAFD